MPNFALSYVKHLLILGIAALTIGSCMLCWTLFFPPVEIVYQILVDTITTSSYLSEKFSAESGYWLELDISSSEVSTLRVIGQIVGEIFKVDGTVYKYTVSFSETDVYQVQVENKAGRWEWFWWVPYENHIYGIFYLKRRPTYFFQLIPVGTILLLAGLLVIPIAVCMEYNARQAAKLLYKCPRCGKDVRIDTRTCPYCKLDLTKYWVRCKYCNKLYDSHHEKCPRCGAERED